MRPHLLFMLVLWPLLAACAAAPTAPVDAGIAPPAMGTGEIRMQPGEVDYSCNVAADCAVKNVGNCCGYYPACVNRDSPTFPERVQEQCAEQGIVGVCGFREISACECVDNRCEAVGTSLGQPYPAEFK